MLKKFAFTIFLSLLFFPSNANEIVQEYRCSSIEKLDNDISIVFVDTIKSESILVMLCISAGNTDEIEKDGVANLLSKVFVKKLNDSAHSLHYGSECNSYVGYDQSVYYFYGKQDNLDGFLKNLGSVFSNFVFSNDELENCKQAIEQSITNEDQIDKLVLRKEARKALFWHSKYGASICGTLDDLKIITIEDINNFKKQHYTNKRANIIIAGNINKKDTIALIKKYFNIQSTKEDIKINRLQEPPHHGSTTKILKYSSQAAVPIIEFYWRIPNYRQEKNKALNTEIFINSLDESLHNSLIEKQKIVSTISFCYSFWNHDYGDFCITITAKNQNNIDDVITAVLSEIKCVASDGMTKEQAKLAYKKLYKASNLVGTDMIDAVDRISKKLGAFYDYEFIRDYPKFIETYNIDEVNTQAKEIFTHDPSVISVIIPETNKNRL